VLFLNKKISKNFCLWGSSIEKCGDLPQEDCAKSGYKARYEVHNCNNASISLTTHSKPTKYI
jgi:hypothetical protein